MAAQDLRRLFFALWPSESMRAALAAASGEARAALAEARLIPARDWHLTLAFLGSVAGSALESVSRAAHEVAHQVRVGGRIEVRLDRVECWAKPQLACATASAASPAAAELAQALHAALLGVGFAPDLKPFRVHVTLARKVLKCPPALALSPVEWSFSEFALIDSRAAPSGSLYSVLATWPLDGA